MTKRAAWLVGLLLALAGCPGEGSGPDASVRKDASIRPDADEVIIGEDAGPTGPDTGTVGLDAGTAGIGWCTLQFPPNASIAVGAKVAIFGQVYVSGQTELNGARTDIEGQVGYGAQGTDGANEASWVWASAVFNKDDANNDEYKAELSPAVGAYGYAYRFRYKGGAWTYCDLNGSGDGYDKAKQGALTVTEVKPPEISWCNLAPLTATAKVGAEVFVSGQVLVTGLTEAAGQGAGIVGQVGFGPVGSDPRASTEWTWGSATFLQDVGNNDEYKGRVVPANPGKYAYAYRFRLNTGDPVYCDTVGHAPAQFDATKLGALDVTALTVDWCNLQFPASAKLTVGDSLTAFGQVFVAGSTEVQGAGADVEGELGVGAKGTDGATDASWSWTPATYNDKDVGDNDEYAATFKPAAIGDYEYAYRFRYKGGAWTYCDLDSSTNGYDKAKQGALNVAAVKPPQVDWCDTHFPPSATITVGEKAPIFGQVFVAGVTDKVAAGAEVEGQVGIGAKGTDGSTDGSWSWSAATFNRDETSNDEYKAELSPATVGDYEYAYRFRYKGGAWTYCDLDSSTNGYDKAKQGALKVAAVKPPQVDWCNLQFPASATILEGDAVPVFGQVFVNSVTSGPGAGGDVEGQVGYGPTGTDGSTATNWTWAAAAFLKDVGDNDEYSAQLSPAKGTYAYAYRFRYKAGPWTYCDLDASANGYAGAQQGALTVNAKPQATVDYCVLQWPSSGTIVEGTTFTIYGQAYKAGVTEPAGKAADLDGEYGFGPAGTDGSTDGSWTWAAATFNKDASNNDEFLGAISATQGNYGYAYRFRYKQGAWTYCDLDGSTNGYAKAQQGALTVNAPVALWSQLRGLVAGVENVGAQVKVEAEVFVAGLTDKAGQGAGITADVGFGPVADLPSAASWTWKSAAYAGDAGGTAGTTNDLYAGWFVAPAAGSYAVAMRFTKGGQVYYADLDGSTGVALVELAHLATFPEPAKADNDIGWCNLQWPPTMTAAPGAATPLAFGQVWVDTVTSGTGQGAGLTSQLGWGAAAASPRTDAFTWTSATWNADSGNNDEYKASFVAPAAGSYRYVYRVRRDKGWTYCDTDGSTGAAEFDPAKSGVLTVQ